MLDDPTAPAIYRTSGVTPYPQPGDPLPDSIGPRKVTLRDRITAATILPFSSPTEIPLTLLGYLHDQFSREIEKGDTYPMIEPLSLEAFGPYWFGLFGAVMLLGDFQEVEQVHALSRQGVDWDRACLGSFYIKPNYPGRSSHICNGGFLVTDGARNRGVGRLMGEAYLEWAPKLGYTYSVFNLVYETNVASCKIWDALGFKRIGRVKGAGNLRSHPDERVDAIIYGRELGMDEDLQSEERFEKIRFYLKHGKYPNGADRAEKSRLRSAATHYKLVGTGLNGTPEKLMLKGKEVIADPQKQYDVARTIHLRSHGGINKTTAAIAESYHWVRIKETVSQVIRNCTECNELNKNVLHRQPAQPITYRAGESGPDAVKLQAKALADARAAASNPIPDFKNIRYSHVPLPREQREESPSAQLQMEASRAQAQEAQANGQGRQQPQQQPPQIQHSYVETAQIPHPYGAMPAQYQTTYEMPLDPALMHNHQMNLQDLPPSPFLAASRSLASGNLPALAMAPPVADMTGSQNSHGVAMPQFPTHQDMTNDVQMGNTNEEELLPRKATLRRGLRPTRGRGRP